MFRLALGKGTSKVARRVRSHKLVGNGVSEDAANELQGAMGLLVVLGRLERPHGLQYLEGLDLRDRAIADRLVHKLGEPSSLDDGIGCKAIALALSDKCFGDGIERV